MPNNLLKTVQENLGYPPLQKVDASTQEVFNDDSKPPEDRFSQAVMPTVLAALFKYSRADESADAILHADLSRDWTVSIFGDHRNEVIEKIAAYSEQTTAETFTKISAVTNETIRVIRQRVAVSGNIIEVKNLLTDSLDDALLYLPVNMQMGELLHDNGLDDSTHKMDGPISGLMHAIGRSFSRSGSDKNRPVA